MKTPNYHSLGPIRGHVGAGIGSNWRLYGLAQHGQLIRPRRDAELDSQRSQGARPSAIVSIALHSHCPWNLGSSQSRQTDPTVRGTLACTASASSGPLAAFYPFTVAGLGAGRH